MATLYWGPSGGSSTGTWDLTTTTNWFTDVARTIPASAAPTSVDDVVFDASSDAGGIFTVTIGASGAVCNDVTISGLDQVMTLAGAGAWDIYGSMLLPATNLTRTFTGVITFRATTTGKTVTTNGVSLATGGNFVFDGVGGEWTLGSALTSSNVTVTNGSFISNNQNITAGGGIISSNTNVRSISLGSSVITSSGATPIQLATTTNLTWDAGTSTITCSGASPTFNGGGLTFYNVSFTSNAAGTTTVQFANTFNSLSQTSRAATGFRTVVFNANQIINGTLTLGAANTAIRRIIVRSSAVGAPRTLTLNGTLAALADVDFRDIVAAGTVATPWTGTRLADCLGNSNITFDAPKTVYRVGTGNWSATQWSLSSGGAVDVNNFPLAQDTMVFDTGTVTGTHTIDAGWQLGTLNCSLLAVAATIATGTQTPAFYGNIVLDADITLTGTGVITFAGQGVTRQITTAGDPFTQPLTIDAPLGTVQLQDNLTTASTSTVTLTAGTLDLNNRTLSTGLFNSNNTNTRSVAFGTGNITVTGNAATVWNTVTATNLTITGTPVVNATYAGSTGTRQVNTGSAATYNPSNPKIALNISAGTDTFTLPGLNVYGNVNFTGFTGTYSFSASDPQFFGDLTFSTGMTGPNSAVRSLIFNAASGTQTITSNSVVINSNIIVQGGSTCVFADALTMGATNTFTFSAGTIQLKNGVTSTVGNFVTSGTNQKFLQSTTPGSQATLSEATGTVNAQYLTIRDINATGGATWNAFVDQGNIDAGNNDGWDFGISPIVGGNEYTYQLRSFTQPRRF